MAADLRLEQTAGNLANMSTPGYRAGAVFSELVGMPAESAALTTEHGAFSALKTIGKNEPGGLMSTGSPLDLSVAGEGYFRVRTNAGDAYTRGGRFGLAADGQVVNAQGHVLLDVSGSEITLQSPVPEVLGDGTVIEDGRVVGRIGVYDLGEGVPSDAGGRTLIAAPEGFVPVQSGSGVRQGVYEGSNVSVPAEMIEMMRAVKQAESGARLAQAYDGLLGQAITTFGQRK